MVSWATPRDHAQWLVLGTAGVEVEQCPAMDAVRAYLARPTLDWVIVLASMERGSGKSLAAAWLRAKLQELSGLREDVTDANERSWSSYFMWCDCAALRSLGALKPWERARELSELSECWGLVVDDVGTEEDPGIVKGLLTVRHAAKLLTVCTTNLVDGDGQPTKAWRARYGGPIASRLKQDGDHKRGSRRAWCYCPNPDGDMRGRVTPRLTATSSRPTEIEVDIDALAGPLLAKMRRPRQDPAAETRAESLALAEAARRKVWGGVALKVLGDRALAEDPAACDVLDEIARRVYDG
jgi:hypothetical protein